MAVTWPGPDVGSLTQQNYEMRWISTKSSVKSEQKNLEDF